jgi:hypothetical protein
MEASRAALLRPVFSHNLALGRRRRRGHDLDIENMKLKLYKKRAKK